MIVTAILARNEADRYLPRVITECKRFSDIVLLLDDNSTDHTAELAHEMGCLVRTRTGEPMWGQEVSARQELWDWAAEEAGNGWVLICDADQILTGDPKPLATSWQVNTWGFPLYDCWDSEQHYRADGFWQGYAQARAWMFRPSSVPAGWEPTWPDRGVHCGHAPNNWPALMGVAPPDCYYVHLGWAKPEDRLAKYERYQSCWDQLSDFERGHVMSIVT